MAIHNTTSYITPNQVIGYESGHSIGYSRESFDLDITGLTLALVGQIFEVDHVAKTAKVIDVPATVEDVEALGDLGIFIGRDLPVNPIDPLNDYDRLSARKNGKIVCVVRGDQGMSVYKGALAVGATKFYSLPADVRSALQAKLTRENRFKVLDSSLV
jgi:hypothetical protein